jgi:hypothetical protein
MSILENIKKIKADFKESQEQGRDFPLAMEIQAKSVEAIIGGADSEAWVEYMKIFASPDDPQQLARLIPTDHTENDPEKRLARAYIVGNGPCGPITLTKLDFTVNDTLDY